MFIHQCLSSAFSHHQQTHELVHSTSDKIANELNIKIRSHTVITAVDPNEKSITTQQGENIKYAKLVLAVGATPKKPVINGDAADAIVQINHLDDYLFFRQQLEHCRHILIIGSGLICCEFVNDLYHYSNHTTPQKQPVKITVVSQDTYPMMSAIPDKAGNLLKDSLLADWQFNTTLTALNHANGRLCAKLTNGQTIAADLVLCAMGLEPNIALAKNAKLKVDHGILVNEKMQTSNTHIYAIGDCVQTQEGVLPFIAPISHQVETAALNIVGQKKALVYPPMPVKVKVDIGLVFLKPPTGANIRWTVSYTNNSLKALTYSKKGRINGFVLMGEAQNELASLLKKSDTNI